MKTPSICSPVLTQYGCHPVAEDAPCSARLEPFHIAAAIRENTPSQVLAIPKNSAKFRAPARKYLTLLPASCRVWGGSAMFGSFPHRSGTLHRVSSKKPNNFTKCANFHFGTNRRERSPGCLHTALFSSARLVLFCLSLVVLSSHAEDWPQFLGPRADGTSTETNLLDRFPADGPPVLWEKEIGTGYSAPSVRDGKLVLHHRIGNEEIVEAFTAAEGKPLWRYPYPTKFVDPYGYNNGPRCTPLLTSNRCYTFGAEGKLLCLDLAKGKLVWERDTQKDWSVPEAFFGVGSTPVLEGGKLLVMIGGQPNSGMVAFDAATGKTIWESVGEKNWEGEPMIGWPGERTVDWKRHRNDKQASYATPVVATVNGERLVFCLMRQGLVALDPANGKVKFSHWFRAQPDESVNAANPVVVDDQVFISTAYYKLGSTLLKLSRDNKSVEPVWRSTALEIHWTTPIYHEGYLYAFSGRNPPDARFRCVEFKSGKVMWDRDERWRRYGDALGTYGRGSAIMAEGKLIVLGEAGLLGLFQVNPTQAEELSRYQVPQLKYPCWAAPILSDRRVYLRSENKLLCLDFAKRSPAK